ncbi:A/G-specific adenine glycosylase [soil metagenome]
MRSALLGWYEAHARRLPWRIGPAEKRAGVVGDPYAVWLSEVMLQQTTTAHAAPYYNAFLQRWPSVERLAAVADEDLMAAWAGLGYYARARNLLACARAVANDHGGRFPDTEAGLLSLPGVGAYTAAAVAAIAFDRPANVVDGNVERVVSRLFATQTPLPAAKFELKALAATLVAADRPGDWAQALMDLGAVVCRPKNPLCLVCPLNAECRAYASGEPERWPKKAAKGERPQRFGAAFVMRRGDEVALVRRPEKGLLGGMAALPTTEWGPQPLGDVEALALAPAPARADFRFAGSIDHVFTHFPLRLDVWVGEGTTLPEGARWVEVEAARSSLPTVFRRALDRGLG